MLGSGQQRACTDIDECEPSASISSSEPGVHLAVSRASSVWGEGQGYAYGSTALRYMVRILIHIVLFELTPPGGCACRASELANQSP